MNSPLPSGPFNSWDRQPFLTEVGQPKGKASLIPDYTQIHGNYILSNYGAGFGVDNDDTSSYYKIYENFFYMGGGVKCDYDGHEKYFYGNVMMAQAGGAACHHTCAYKKGHPDQCFNNSIVQGTPQDYKKGDRLSPFAIIW